VGLDVVKAEVESMHGSVRVETQKGIGTDFIISLPLTLTTLRGFIVKAANQYFAVSISNVEKIIKFLPSKLRSVEGKDTYILNGISVPVCELGKVLNLEKKKRSNRDELSLIGLVLQVGEKRRVIMLVDELLGEQEIVLKGFGRRISRVKNFSGVAILPGDKIALILNAYAIIEAGLSPQSVQLIHSRKKEQVNKKRRVLFVDDSLTTRGLIKSILESAGYDVTVGTNGSEGWKLLQDSGADLVVSDVEMPEMNGFEFVETIRNSERFKKLPVVLVTSLSKDSDKKRGVTVGANAYVVKGDFDQQNLLQTIKQLL